MNVSPKLGLGSILGPLGGNIIGGLFGASGQRSANQQNLQIAREQMRFQERMSSTAAQRAAKDYEAAGLNRILALGKPATTPAGAQQTMQNEKKALQEGITSGVSTALQAKKLTQEIRESNSRILLQNQQAVKEKAQADQIQSQSGLQQAHTQESMERQANIIKQRLGIETQNKILELNRQIRKLRIPSVQAEADLWRWLASANIDEISKVIPGAGKLAAGVLRYFMIYLKQPGKSVPGFNMNLSQ